MAAVIKALTSRVALRTEGEPAQAEVGVPGGPLPAGRAEHGRHAAVHQPAALLHGGQADLLRPRRLRCDAALFEGVTVRPW